MVPAARFSSRSCRVWLLDWAKDEDQHVEEVNADVGGDAARFAEVALPRHVIPAPARGDVGEVDLVVGAARGGDLVSELDDLGMQAQLQDGRDLLAGFLLEGGEAIEVPGVQHQRLLADDVGAGAQSEAAVRVVQIVGRADRDVLDGLALPAQFVDVAVEALELDEEVRVGEMAVHDADAVVGVHGHDQIAADGFDRFHVARRDIPAGADQCKGFGHVGLELILGTRPAKSALARIKERTGRQVKSRSEILCAGVSTGTDGDAVSLASEYTVVFLDLSHANQQKRRKKYSITT